MIFQCQKEFPKHISVHKLSIPWHKLNLPTELRKFEIFHDGYTVDIHQDALQPRVIYTLCFALPLSLQWGLVFCVN